MFLKNPSICSKSFNGFQIFSFFVQVEKNFRFCCSSRSKRWCIKCNRRLCYLQHALINYATFMFIAVVATCAAILNLRSSIKLYCRLKVSVIEIFENNSKLYCNLHLSKIGTENLILFSKRLYDREAMFLLFILFSTCF